VIHGDWSANKQFLSHSPELVYHQASSCVAETSDQPNLSPAEGLELAYSKMAWLYQDPKQVSFHST